MDPCPEGAQQCCAPATEWRRRDKPAATKARQRARAWTPARMGRSSAAPLQQNEDGGINPPLQRQDRRARPATEWRRRDKPAATKARQKSTTSNRMKMAG